MKSETFECDSCHAKFSSNVGLTNHKRKCGTTEPIEDLECDICHTPYKSSHGLKNHRKKCAKFDQEKMLKCDQCHMLFPNPSALSHHQKNSHFESVKCLECDYRCNSNFQLRTHVSILIIGSLFNSMHNKLWDQFSLG